MARLFLLYNEYVAGGLRRERVFRDHFNPLEQYSEMELYQRFRFKSHGIRYLVDLLSPDLFQEIPTNRSHAIPVVHQICAALRFYACGSFLQVVGDTGNLSKSSLCMIVKRVSIALVQRMSTFIKFPSTDREVATVRQKLFDVAGFPGVTGIIDCTHIKIMAPGEHENDFVNRRSYHSINCQFVCRENGIFTNCTAVMPGSSLDSRVFNGSSLGQKLQQDSCPPYLLGDSGYACRPWLLTPFLQPRTGPEKAYNLAHKRTKVLIEQAFGRFKRCFAGLHSGLRVKPGKACLIIGACAILHNIAIDLNQPDDLDDVDDDDNGDYMNDDDEHINLDEQLFRRRIVFANFT